MKKLSLLLFCAITLLCSCGVSTSDGEERSVNGPSTPSNPNGTPSTGAASISSVCSNYTCYYGCKGVNLFTCETDGQYYSNETGSYVTTDVEPFLATYISICGDGEACSEPNSSTVNKGGSSNGGGGNSLCSQLGCGGIFCSGKCTGCPGCY